MASWKSPEARPRSVRAGWLIPFWNEQQAGLNSAIYLPAGALLLGRVTYRGFAAAWPSMTDEAGIVDRMNSLPKYVVSTTLERVEWNNSSLIKTNIAQEENQLKQQPGQDILVFGSSQLVQMAMLQGSIDEYRLMVFPVVRGVGNRLFRDISDQTVLKLVDTQTFRSSVVALTYQPVKGVKDS